MLFGTATAALLAPMLVTSGLTGPGVITRGLAIGHEVIVDHQRVTGEPSLRDGSFAVKEGTRV